MHQCPSFKTYMYMSPWQLTQVGGTLHVRDPVVVGIAVTKFCMQCIHYELIAVPLIINLYTKRNVLLQCMYSVHACSSLGQVT